MRTKSFLLPGIALGAAVILVAPAPESVGFSKLGGSLSTESQRDFRVFNNFADSQTNNNTSDHPNFPGWDGAELALWKASIEWGNQHGDGSGDPLQATLGSGGADFEAYWAGAASGVGGTNDNIHSAIGGCSSGVLAFAETPISNGWRIRYCDNAWVWHDGPGDNTNGFDLQGVGCHEYGHALGLGHSGVSGATMFPSTSGGGSSNWRSINADDMAGLQCIYGVAGGDKPTVTGVTENAGIVTITGTGFHPSDNEVWFTNANVTGGSNPRVRVTGVSSSGGGTTISVAIPANAGVGAIHVRDETNGHSSLSNPWPFGGGPPPAIMISSVSPSTWNALNYGPVEFVTITGVQLDNLTELSIDGNTVDPSLYTVVSSTEITLDPPQVPGLGFHTLEVTDGVNSDSSVVTTIANGSPTIQVGDGTVFYQHPSGTTLDIITAGDVGSVVYVWYSFSNFASCHPIVKLDIGNNFTDLNLSHVETISASGWNLTQFPGVVGTFTTVFTQGTVLFQGTPWPTTNTESMIIF